MIDANQQDHMLGLELELVELVEQRERARVQGRIVDARRIDHEVHRLQEEMATTAEAMAAAPAPRPRFDDQMASTTT